MRELLFLSTLPFLPFEAVLGGSANTSLDRFRNDSMLMEKVGADVLSDSHLRSYLVAYLNDDEAFVMTLPANGLIH
jgi:hypothetical protein